MTDWSIITILNFRAFGILDNRALALVVVSALCTESAALCAELPQLKREQLPAVELAKEGTPPLTAKITLDTQIDNPETFRGVKSSLLVDSTAQDMKGLTLENVVSLVARRNLTYIQNRWLGRSAALTFAGNVGNMVPYGFSLNKSGTFLISSAMNPNPQQVLVYAQQQTQFQIQSAQAALTGEQPPNPPEAPNNQNPNFRTVDREGYITSTANISSGGSAVFNMLSSFFKYRATNASVVTSLQDAMSQSVISYHQLCQQLSLLHVADIVVQNADNIVRLNQGLVDAGMGSRLQLLQAKTQLAADRQQLVNQQVQARVAAINLAVSLNLPLSKYLLPAARPLEKITLVDPNLPVETLVHRALKQRPEIVQQRNTVNQQFVQAASALSPILPSASYQTQQGRFFPSTNAGSTDGIQHVLQIGWQFNNMGVPVIPNVAAGLASARAAQYNLYNTELQIRSQVRQAFDNSLAAEKNIEIAREAAIDAQEQLKLAEERLRAGIGINIDVIQAQSTLTIALRNYVQAIYGYNIQQTQLRRAIGGFTLKDVQARLRYE